MSITKDNPKPFDFVGIHTYAGGMGFGVQQNEDINFNESVELWKGPEVFHKLNKQFKIIDSIDAVKDKFDVTFGNPPCARFSTMRVVFDHEDNINQQKNLGTFPELYELLQLGLKSESKAIWWETGPIAFTRSHELIEQIHETLNARWGEGKARTVVFLVDNNYWGIPQLRPRTHIVHFKYDEQDGFLFENPTAYPKDFDLYKWVQDKVGDVEKVHPHIPSGYESHGITSAKEWHEKVRELKSFRCGWSHEFGSDDVTSLTVISSRSFIWKDYNRFFDITELAALMCYPIEFVKNVADEIGVNKTVFVLCKSVCPDVAYHMSKVVVSLIDKDAIADDNQFAVMFDDEFKDGTRPIFYHKTAQRNRKKINSVKKQP